MSRISKWRCDLKLLDCFLVRSILAAGSFFGGFVRFLQDSSGFFQTAGGRLDCGGGDFRASQNNQNILQDPSGVLEDGGSGSLRVVSGFSGSYEKLDSF